MKTPFYRLVGRVILSAAICFLSISTVQAAKRLSQAQQLAEQASLRGQTPEQTVDSLVRVLDFQFIPATLNGQVDGNYAIYKYQNTPGFPLWLMINMGGPLLMDRETFTVNQTVEKVQDGVRVWLVNASCADSVNGTFDLQFVIEAATGKTALNVTQTAPGAPLLSDQEYPKEKSSFLFQGYIYPTMLIYTYKNAKQKQQAMESQQLLDVLVPALNFRVGNQTFNPTLLERQFASLVCMEKCNDIWYVRFEFPASRNKYLKTSVLDLAINARNGETYQRRGLYDYLLKNWQNYQGRIVFTTSN